VCQPLPASASDLCQKSLKAAGGDVQALRQAATRFMGPLERDLLVVEGILEAKGSNQPEDLSLAERLAVRLGSAGAEVLKISSSSGAAAEVRKQVYAAVLARWASDGYLATPPPKQSKILNPITLSEDSYGRDIGSELPCCRLRDSGVDDPVNTLDAQGWMQASESLQSTGAVLLRSALAASQIEELRQRLGVHMSALDVRRQTVPFPPIREHEASALLAVDPELEPSQSSPGKKHYTLRGKALESVVTGVQAGLAPLLWEQLAQIASDRGLPRSKRPYLSEVQLVISEPCAAEQFWHIDNISPGLTVYVPLTAAPEEMGVTQFLPGSHFFFAKHLSIFRRIANWGSSCFASDGITGATMDAGDALIYDSRVLHRTSANRLYNRTRVDLVFRYDYERPPGITITDTHTLMIAGQVLSALLQFYRKLPGAQRAEA